MTGHGLGILLKMESCLRSTMFDLLGNATSRIIMPWISIGLWSSSQSTINQLNSSILIVCSGPMKRRAPTIIGNSSDKKCQLPWRFDPRHLLVNLDKIGFVVLRVHFQRTNTKPLCRGPQYILSDRSFTSRLKLGLCITRITCLHMVFKSKDMFNSYSWPPYPSWS